MRLNHMVVALAIVACLSCASSTAFADLGACCNKGSSALSQLDVRVDGLQFASCVFDFHLPINASLPRVNIS